MFVKESYNLNMNTEECLNLSHKPAIVKVNEFNN